MNQPKKKPLAAAVVAGGSKTPYTATRDGKNGAMTGAGADAFGQALDRRLTEGLNLIHGRLDVIQADVRENRGDIKGLRKELWDGLREANVDRGRLAGKAELDGLRAEMNERFGGLEESQRELVGAVGRLVEHSASTDRRLGGLEQSQRELVGAVGRLVEHSASTDRRLAALEESQRELRAEMSARLAALEESQRALRAEMNARLAALEESQGELIRQVSTVLERSSAAAWTRRQITVGVWVAVGAGTSLLVIGAVMRPVLERAVAALFGG